MKIGKKEKQMGKRAKIIFFFIVLSWLLLIPQVWAQEENSEYYLHDLLQETCLKPEKEKFGREFVFGFVSDASSMDIKRVEIEYDKELNQRERCKVYVSLPAQRGNAVKELFTFYPFYFPSGTKFIFDPSQVPPFIAEEVGTLKIDEEFLKKNQITIKFAKIKYDKNIFEGDITIENERIKVAGIGEVKLKDITIMNKGILPVRICLKEKEEKDCGSGIIITKDDVKLTKVEDVVVEIANVGRKGKGKIVLNVKDNEYGNYWSGYLVFDRKKKRIYFNDIDAPIDFVNQETGETFSVWAYLNDVYSPRGERFLRREFPVSQKVGEIFENFEVFSVPQAKAYKEIWKIIKYETVNGYKYEFTLTNCKDSHLRLLQTLQGHLLQGFFIFSFNTFFLTRFVPFTGFATTNKNDGCVIYGGKFNTEPINLEKKNMEFGAAVLAPEEDVSLSTEELFGSREELEKTEEITMETGENWKEMVYNFLAKDTLVTSSKQELIKKLKKIEEKKKTGKLKARVEFIIEPILETGSVIVYKDPKKGVISAYINSIEDGTAELWVPSDGKLKILRRDIEKIKEIIMMGKGEKVVSMKRKEY